jgi:hypothetical protein
VQEHRSEQDAGKPTHENGTFGATFYPPNVRVGPPTLSLAYSVCTPGAAVSAAFYIVFLCFVCEKRKNEPLLLRHTAYFRCARWPSPPHSCSSVRSLTNFTRCGVAKAGAVASFECSCKRRAYFHCFSFVVFRNECDYGLRSDVWQCACTKQVPPRCVAVWRGRRH